MDYKLGLVIIPVSDVDRAKTFYEETVGFRLDVDFSEGDFRVVQLSPRGSSCAIALMANPAAAGSVQGLHLLVSDIDAARKELTGRGLEVSEIFHFEAGQPVSGPEPERRDFGSFLSFADPDGTGWMVQEARSGDRVSAHDPVGE
jgi:predicted enzyme related to lactoylglutathione lyase